MKRTLKQSLPRWLIAILILGWGYSASAATCVSGSLTVVVRCTGTFARQGTSGTSPMTITLSGPTSRSMIAHSYPMTTNGTSTYSFAGLAPGSYSASASNPLNGNGWGYTMTVDSAYDPRPNRPPSATISATTTDVKTNASATITFSASDPDNNLTSWRFYKSTNGTPQWSSVGASGNSGTYTVSGASVGIGTHTYYIEARDAGNLSDSESITIVVTDPVRYYKLNVTAGAGGSASGSAPSLVGNATPSISATPNAGFEFDYWSGDAVNDSTSSSTTIAINGQDRSVRANFKPKPAPVPKKEQSVSISPTSRTIHVGDTVGFTTTGGAGSGAWTWSGASGSGSSASKTFSSIGTYTVSVYKAGDSTYYASNTATSTISVQPTPPNKSAQTVWLSPITQTVHVGDSVSFVASGGAGSGTWYWTGVSGFGTAASRTFPSTGTYSVSVYKAGDADHYDSNTASSTITVRPPKLPQTVALSPASRKILVGESVAFVASGGFGGGQWNWTGVSAMGNSALHTFSDPGTYSVTVFKDGDADYERSNSAVSSISAAAASTSAVTVSFLLPSQIKRPIAGVETTAVSFSATSENGTLVEYRWSVVAGDGSAIAGSDWTPFRTETVGAQSAAVELSTGSVDKQLLLSPSTPLGVCAVAFFARDAHGRTGSLTRTTEIIPAELPQTVAITPTSAVITAGDQIRFSAAGGRNGYVWGGAAEGSGMELDVRFTSPGSSQVSVHSPAGAGYSRSNTATASIVINPAPQTVTITPARSIVAPNQPVRLSASGGMNGYTWGGVATGEGDSHTFSFPGVGSFGVNVFSPAGGAFAASNTAFAEITVAHLQTIEFPAPGSFLLKTMGTHLVATASSGLPVRFTVVAGPGSMTTPDYLRFGTIGAIVVQADQEGNASYQPAIPVQRTVFVINPPETELRTPGTTSLILGDHQDTNMVLPAK